MSCGDSEKAGWTTGLSALEEPTSRMVAEQLSPAIVLADRFELTPAALVGGTEEVGAILMSANIHTRGAQARLKYSAIPATYARNAPALSS